MENELVKLIRKIGNGTKQLNQKNVLKLTIFGISKSNPQQQSIIIQLQPFFQTEVSRHSIYYLSFVLFSLVKVASQGKNL